MPVFKFSGIGPESRVTTPGYFTGGYGHNGHFSIGQVEGEIPDVTDENQAFEISIDLWDTDPLIADDEHIAYKTFKVLPTEQIQRSEQLQADGIADSSKLPPLEYILRPADHPAYNWITIRP